MSGDIERPISQDIIESKIQVPAPDDWTLSATVFTRNQTKTNPGPVVLISAAAGVPQGFYASFSRFLVESGAQAAVTYDYRGMSASAGDRKRWPDLRMRDWALMDLPAMVAWTKTQFNGHTLVGMGHSFGGQALGLTDLNDDFQRYATVASMSGYWRNLGSPTKIWVQTQIMGGLIANILGSLPKGLSPGETFPGPVYLEWARWIRSPNYFFDDSSLEETQNFSNITLPFLSIGIGDDPWGTQKAVDSLLQHYSNAELYEMWVKPGESGPIGHLGYFRKQHRGQHWNAVRAFLLEGRVPDGATRR